MMLVPPGPWSFVVLDGAGFLGGEQVGRQLRDVFAPGVVERVDAVIGSAAGGMVPTRTRPRSTGLAGSVLIA